MENILDLIMTFATVVAVAIAGIAALIARDTVKRAELDYLAARADRTSADLERFTGTINELDASLHPYWKPEEPPVAQENYVHLAFYNVEASAEALKRSITALHWSLPEKASEEDVQRLKDWVDFVVLAAMLMYRSLLQGHWGLGPIQNDARTSIEYELRSLNGEMKEIVRHRIALQVGDGQDAANITTNLVKDLGLGVLSDNLARLLTYTYRTAAEGMKPEEARDLKAFWKTSDTYIAFEGRV